jgi:hypothetical protein
MDEYALVQDLAPSFSATAIDLFILCRFLFATNSGVALICAGGLGEAYKERL